MKKPRFLLTSIGLVVIAISSCDRHAHAQTPPPLPRQELPTARQFLQQEDARKMALIAQLLEDAAVARLEINGLKVAAATVAKKVTDAETLEDAKKAVEQK